MKQLVNRHVESLVIFFSFFTIFTCFVSLALLVLHCTDLFSATDVLPRRLFRILFCGQNNHQFCFGVLHFVFCMHVTTFCLPCYTSRCLLLLYRNGTDRDARNEAASQPVRCKTFPKQQKRTWVKCPQSACSVPLFFLQENMWKISISTTEGMRVD